MKKSKFLYFMNYSIYRNFIIWNFIICLPLDYTTFIENILIKIISLYKTSVQNGFRHSVELNGFLNSSILS